MPSVEASHWGMACAATSILTSTILSAVHPENRNSAWLGDKVYVMFSGSLGLSQM